MLLVAAVLLGSSTFAWFSMNRVVTATSMQVKARAEGGILIKRTITSGDATDASVNFGSTSAVALLPTSTNDASAWWHAAGTAENDGTGIAASYETLTLTNTAPAAAALGTGTKGDAANGLYYYVYDSFTVVPDSNSSAFTDLWVSECSVASANQELSKSLRIAIVCGSNVVICAPIEGATLSYDVGNTGSNNCTAIDTHSSATTALAKSNTTTLATGSASSQTVLVYAYFEGEDENHMTDNLNDALATALEGLVITVRFTCTSVSAATA